MAAAAQVTATTAIVGAPVAANGDRLERYRHFAKWDRAQGRSNSAISASLGASHAPIESPFIDSAASL